MILIVAAFFRFYDLDSLPPGLYPDEAMNGNDVIWAMDTGNYPQLFYSNNNGREGLFINIQGLFIKAFGHEPWALRMVSAIFGVLTVWGLYLLAKELFDHNIAALSAFLMAILFWHVNFSRIGFRAIMIPFILVFEFYFLWRAFKSSKLREFIYAGIFAGLGAYTYISYRVSPLIIIIAFANYWWYLKKDFSDSKYEYAKQRMFKGFVVMVAVSLLVALPMIFLLIIHPEILFSRTGAYLSVFGQDKPFYELLNSIVKTLGMFNFYGDFNWRHNISGSPQLVWPIGVLFVIGFIKELIHLFRMKHGHLSPIHTLLFSWFFVMLLPGFLSTEAPHALRTIGVIPVAMIFAGKGLWWLYEKMHNNLMVYEFDSYHRHRMHVMLNLTLVIFLFAISVVEFSRYHEVWGRNADGAFNQNYVSVANSLKSLSPDQKKYLIVNTDGVMIEIPGDPARRSMPMPAMTVMFLTDTFSYQKQIDKNIYYLTEDEFKNTDISDDSAIIFLEEKKD